MEKIMGERGAADFVETIKAERARVVGEIRAFEKYLRSLDDLLEAYDVPRPPDRTAQGGRSPRVTTVRDIGERAREILLEIGRPLGRDELLSAFEAKGHPVGGKDRRKMLGVNVLRARRPDGRPAIYALKDGYWPSDVPVPDGYSRERRRGRMAEGRRRALSEMEASAVASPTGREARSEP